MVLLLYMCMQVHVLLQQFDFEVGKVQLLIAATARAGSESNATMLTHSVTASVNVTQTPSVVATLALAPGTSIQIDQVGECTMQQ